MPGNQYCQHVCSSEFRSCCSRTAHIFQNCVPSPPLVLQACSRPISSVDASAKSHCWGICLLKLHTHPSSCTALRVPLMAVLCYVCYCCTGGTFSYWPRKAAITKQAHTRQAGACYVCTALCMWHMRTTAHKCKWHMLRANAVHVCFVCLMYVGLFSPDFPRLPACHTHLLWVLSEQGHV